MATMCCSAAVVASKGGATFWAPSGSRCSPSSARAISTPLFPGNSGAKLRRDATFVSVTCELCVSIAAGNSVERRSRCGSRRHSRVFSSREEIPSEILEDSKFVPITSEDPRFGPPAILLLGFTNEEALKVQSLLKEMEGDFMEVLLCTEEMAKGTLGKAFDAVQPNLTDVQVAKGLPRISFLSGLTGEEIMMMIQIFPESGLDPTVFAAHVPLNSDKSMQELMEEIMDDHQRLNKEREPVEQES